MLVLNLNLSVKSRLVAPRFAVFADALYSFCVVGATRQFCVRYVFAQDCEQLCLQSQTLGVASIAVMATGLIKEPRHFESFVA